MQFGRRNIEDVDVVDDAGRGKMNTQKHRIWSMCVYKTLHSQVSLMKYCSTRGGVHGWDFRDVLFAGYAPDGGLFMPESVPMLSPDTLRTWKELSFTKLVVEVTSLFIPTELIPREDLEGELL